jgi:hypothetical protein
MQRGWTDPHYCHLPRRRHYTPALHGAGGNQMVCASAALGGHLEVLQWARGVESKANRRRFAWNREFCLSFASMPVGQGCSWFGSDRPGFDRELCDHAVYAAFSEHHACGAIMRWIVDQPAVHPGEVLVGHDVPAACLVLYSVAEGGGTWITTHGLILFCVTISARTLISRIRCVIMGDAFGWVVWTVGLCGKLSVFERRNTSILYKCVS